MMREGKVDRGQMVRTTRLAVTRTATSAKDITRQKAYQKRRCCGGASFQEIFTHEIGYFAKYNLIEPVFDFVDVS
jgi:hypothetical protein